MPSFLVGPLLAGLLLAALVAGCGQKGPLYLPKPQPSVPEAAAASPPASEPTAAKSPAQPPASEPVSPTTP